MALQDVTESCKHLVRGIQQAGFQLIVHLQLCFLLFLTSSSLICIVAPPSRPPSSSVLQADSRQYGLYLKRETGSEPAVRRGGACLHPLHLSRAPGFWCLSSCCLKACQVYNPLRNSSKLFHVLHFFISLESKKCRPQPPDASEPNQRTHPSPKVPGELQVAPQASVQHQLVVGSSSELPRSTPGPIDYIYIYI